MAAFTWIPDRGASRRSKAGVNKSQFGDGYQQRSGDRINSVGFSWDLGFTLRPLAEILAIRAFLESNKGVTNFTWLAPDGTNYRYTCDSWSDTYNFDGDCSLSAAFDRVFETS